jgi:hypothetical protein
MRLEDGQLQDAGYGEFLCTPHTAEELLAGAMSRVNGVPVRLEIVDRLPNINAVIVRVWENTSDGWVLGHSLRYPWSVAESGRIPPGPAELESRVTA